MNAFVKLFLQYFKILHGYIFFQNLSRKIKYVIL